MDRGWFEMCGRMLWHKCMIFSRRAEILSILQKYCHRNECSAVLFPSSRLCPEVLSTVSSRRQTYTFAIAMWLVACVPFRCYVLQSSKRAYFPDLMAYLLVCVGLIWRKRFG